MLSEPAVIGLSVGTVILLLGLLTIVGSFGSILVLLALAGLLIYVLTLYGYIKVNSGNSNTLDIGFHESPPAPSPTKEITTAPVVQKEVFYVSGNNYRYDEAAAVCGAYEADLATYEQVMEAYSTGAEWCGYGWTQGGMALFPTQSSTWESLQKEVDADRRTSCGRPGVNGGYFDPNTKFGVNCYGVKPSDKGTNKYPIPVPGTDTNTYNNLVNKFKSMINRMSVSPFNRDGWSEWQLKSHA